MSDGSVSRREETIRAKSRDLDRDAGADADGDRVPASQLLRQPEVRLERLAAETRFRFEISAARAVIDVASVETTVKYAGYLQAAGGRDRARAEGRTAADSAGFPSSVFPVSREKSSSGFLKFVRTHWVRPSGPGVTPAAVAVLASYVGRVQPA